VRTGDFTLASGARSSYYVDARRTTMCADPVAYAIAHRSWLEGHPLDGFSVRKKAKEHRRGQRIEGGLTLLSAFTAPELLETARRRC